MNRVYDINESIQDNTSFGSNSIFTKAALSQVINHPIALVYPQMNGLIDPGFRFLTTALYPLRMEQEAIHCEIVPFSGGTETLYIMSTRVGEAQNQWYQNLFVRLLTDSSLQISTKH